MSPNDPPPGDEALTPTPGQPHQPPEEHVQRSVLPPGWHTDLDLPERPIAQAPRWPHPNFWWSWLWCALFLIITQVPGAVVAGGLIVVSAIFFGGDLPQGTGADAQKKLMQSPTMSLSLAVAFFITEILVVGFSWLVIRLVVGRDWMRQLALRTPSLTHTLLALASLPALVLFGSLAYYFLRTVLHVPSFSEHGVGMEEMIEATAQWPWPFAVLVIGVGPGVGEELWCRGFLGRGLVGTYGYVLGALASSFFFGLIHIDPCQGTAVILMGLWLHFVYLTTRSLWLPMMLHFLNNSLGVIIPRIPQLKSLDAEPQAVPLFVTLTAGLLLAAVAYALYRGRARLHAASPDQPLVWRPRYDGVEFPPPGSGTRVVRPLPPLALSLVGGAFVLFVVVCLTSHIGK